MSDLSADDLEIETYRPTGVGAPAEMYGGPYAGNPAVRITHKPTGIKVINQKHKSLVRNRDEAMEELQRMVEGERPWGTKLTYSVYVEGMPQADTIFAGARALDKALDAHFVGVRRDTVRDEPKDQGCS